MKKFSIVFLAGLRMHIINEEDLYLIAQYFEIDHSIINKLYELNQKSFDLKYKLKGQKIKRLPRQDFKFKNITEQEAFKTLSKIRSNILITSLRKWQDSKAFYIINNLIVAYP